MSPGLCNTNVTTTNALVGWVKEDTTRGTFSLMRSSFLTILICTWTAIHPRVHTSVYLARWHKAFQLVKMILAPEMVCLESLQEWVQARKMIKRTAAATRGELGYVHAFYISMLGVRYQTELGHRVLWPAQYAWLLNNKIVSWEHRGSWGLSRAMIRDKNKADGLVKLAALCQVIWFTVQCIVRETRGFSVSPLETMTLAYVFVAILTYLFWWKKPKDISTSSFVCLPDMSPTQLEAFGNLSMEGTYDVDNPGKRLSRSVAWYLVARDCKDDDVLIVGQPHEDAPEARAPSSGGTESPGGDLQDGDRRVLLLQRSRPLQCCNEKSAKSKVEDSKIITQWDESLYMTRCWPLICLLGSAFGAFHLLSWNSHFPTQAELILWRTCAVLSIATSIAVMQFRAIFLHWDGPLALIRVGSPIIYVICRFIMTAQAFAALRSMPMSTYQAVDVFDYWIHV